LLSALVTRIGIGPPSIQSSQLNNKNFYICLHRITTDKELKIRAEVFGEQLREERGGLRTMAFVCEHFFKYWKDRGISPPAAPPQETVDGEDPTEAESNA